MRARRCRRTLAATPVSFQDGAHYVSTCANPGCSGLSTEHAFKFFGKCLDVGYSSFHSRNELLDDYRVCPCGLAVMALHGGEQHFTALLRSSGNLGATPRMRAYVALR